jgi:DNA-binding response OmpR family regulator
VTAKRSSTQPRLLVVNDDLLYGKWLSYHLGVFCPDSSVITHNHKEFEHWCETDAGHECDIVLMTAFFGSSPEDPKAKGLEILRRLRGRTIFPAVIMVAEEGNELTAVRALQLGAVDYLPKRLLTPERLNTSVRLAVRRIEKRVQRKIATSPNATGMVPAMVSDETTREQPKINAEAAASSTPPVTHVPAPATPVSVSPATVEAASKPGAPSGPKVESTPATPPVAETKAPSGLASEHTYTATGVDFRSDSGDEANSSGEELVAALLRIGEQIDSHRAAIKADEGKPTIAEKSRPSVAEKIQEEEPFSAKKIAEQMIAAEEGFTVTTGGSKIALAKTDLERPEPLRPVTRAPSPPVAPTQAEAPSTASTQLMAPGLLAAALDAAAASAIAAGVKPTDSSVFSTTGVGRKSSSGGSSKRSNSSGPAVTAEFIPGYIIKMKIGESEKAVVYLATSISLGSNVALKVSKTLRDDSSGRQFLEREYTAIIAIRDPLVVQIYDYGVHAGFEYLAMEYLLRGDLKARMQAGLKESEALRYVEQIAAALRVVHNAGLLHRDLKPPNVMLRENDDVALIDFGLARALDGSTPSTRTGVLRGSPYYMSPEQAQGELLDVRSDFYSLGIMFYEMLTGRKPFTGATAMEVLQQHVNSPLPPLPHSLSRYDTFLHKLVAKNRNERYGSADEIITALQELRAAASLNVESAVA